MDIRVSPAAKQYQAVICQVCPESERLGRFVAESTDWQTQIITEYVDLMSIFTKGNARVLVFPLGDNPSQTLDLLEEIVEKYPSVVRVVLSGPLTPQQAARAAELAHHCFPLTCDPQTLLADIHKSLHDQALITKPAVKRYVTSLRKLPVLPDVYERLNACLNSDRTNAREVAKIIEQDPVVTAKIMQLVNSAYFGLSREISRIQEAVTVLGVRMIRDLVLSSHLFESYPQTDEWKSFSFKQMHQRSMAVAKAAQHIARAAKADRHVQSQAFLAGLLHDFGVLILASHSPEEYHKVISKAGLMEQPVYAIEKLELGVTHAEVGAYLLALWNLPPKVVEAVLFHHFPKASNSNAFTPLTAVHVADALLPAATSVVGCDMSSRLSVTYLEQIGVDQELERWQLITADYQQQVGFV